MAPSLQSFITLFFLLFTLFQGDLKANTECNSAFESIECQEAIDNLSCAEDNPCYTPDWHYTYGISHNSATFEWGAVYGASYYSVQWRYPGGTWNNVPGGYCYQNWITVNNFQSCTAYEWRVRSHCGYGYASNWCYPNYFTTTCNYCYSPSWLQCYDITGYSATWKWASVSGAYYYSIQWRYPGGSWYDLGGGPFYGTWTSVNHLNPCTTYEYRVRSYCYSGGWGNYCSPHTFTTTCHSSCPVPGGMMTKDIGDTKATFKWNPVYGAHTYSIQIRDHYGYWYDVPGSPTSGIWITAYNLTPCKTYEWRIKANCNYYSNSYWSPSKYFTTTCGHGCYAPEWVYTNGVTGSSALLHWGPVIGADYYVVEYQTGGGVWTQAPGGPWTNTVGEITGLQSNTTYRWRVKAHCFSGHFSGWSSETHFITSGLTCGMPFFRYTLPVTESTATFNWSAVSGASNYTVQVREMNGQWQDVVGSPTTGTSITATSLAPHTTYEWRMLVNCSNGATSVWLSALMFTTGTTSSCPTPGSLFADQLTLNSAVLHWAEVPGAVSYNVQIRSSAHGAWNTVAGSPVNTNSIYVDGLSPFATYEWRVRATCAGSVHSFYSVSSHFTTTNLPGCNPPGDLSSSLMTETTVTLNWSAVTGAIGYQVQSRLPNGIWVDIPGGSVVNPTLLATGFTPNTTYEWRVRTQCDTNHFSSYSLPASFTTIGTNPGNNDCLNATLLTVETSCVTTFASNVDATASQPPPAGGCGVTGYKDVWFKFTMPDVQNPTVTIRTSAGSMGNGVMEVYSGSDCGILSLIACEDDNNNGNGSTMPVINLTGTPNATIWVRVWGVGGSTGTFTICVFNYISFNYTVSGDKDLPSEGESIEILETDIPVVIDMEQKPVIQLKPNPARDILNVEVQQTESCNVVGLRILDLSGKVVFTQKVESVKEDQFRSGVDVSGFAPGIYLLQVQTPCGIMSEKVSVVR